MRTIPQLAAALWDGWNNPGSERLAASLTPRERLLILAAHKVGQQRREEADSEPEILRDVCRAVTTTGTETARGTDHV